MTLHVEPLLKPFQQYLKVKQELRWVGISISVLTFVRKIYNQDFSKIAQSGHHAFMARKIVLLPIVGLFS